MSIKEQIAQVRHEPGGRLVSIAQLEAALLDVANCDSAMAALPNDVRAEILCVKGEVERRVKEREEAERKRESERREAEEAAKTRSAIEQIAQFFKKNQAYRVMVELMLPKRLHPAWERVLNEFCQKPQQKKKEKERKNEK